MKRILVIDDEENLLMLMVETLQFLGFETLTASNGTRGIEMAIEQKPDFILCDLNMPTVDGFETLSILRRTESTATMPFILLSGYLDRSTRKQAVEKGANGIIGKPFSIAELLGTLDSSLKEAA